VSRVYTRYGSLGFQDDLSPEGGRSAQQDVWAPRFTLYMRGNDPRSRPVVVDEAEAIAWVAFGILPEEPTAKKLSREQRRNKRHRGQAP
jgi:hypothetical protein